MDSNEKTFKDLNDVLGEYAKASGYMPRKIIKEKATQFVLGSDSKYTANPFKGIYERTWEYAPLKGAITTKVMGILHNGGGILISKKSKERAESILGEGQSGLFKINEAKRGIQLVTVLVDAKGRHFNGNTKKNKSRGGQQAVLGLKVGKNTINRANKKAGEIVLNRQSLAAFFEIRKREKARGYSAIAYIGKLLKQLTKQANSPYCNAAITNRNSANNTISQAEIRADKNSAYFALTNYTTGANKPLNQRLVNEVFKNVISDMQTYITRKMQEQGEEILRKKGY